MYLRKHLAAALALAAIGTAGIATAADHREAPLVQEDSSVDINDVCAFIPSGSSNLTLVMTVNPFSVPSEGTTFKFSPNAHYAFKIETNGDPASAEHTLYFEFTNIPGPGSPQVVSAVLDGTEIGAGAVTQATLEPTANPPVIINGTGGVKFFAGPRDDPFFFDVVGFNRFLAGTGGFSGSDGFAGYNVSAIVCEIPLSMIADGSTNIEVWGITTRKRYTVRKPTTEGLEIHRGDYEQIDRMGVPAVNTALVPAARKDEYNKATPKDDANGKFADDIVASLTALGTDSAHIGVLASVAVPDTLKIDTTAATNFPNGRNLSDDVIDTILTLILNEPAGGVHDMVNGNDVAFLSTFPYLAAPHQPPPSPAP